MNNDISEESDRQEQLGSVKIASITLDRFKGLSERLDVEHLNYLTGPNGSGKTARLQAVEFAVTGKTDLGASLDSTMRLGAADGCAVTVELDDGFVWTRGLKRTRAGSITETFEIGGKAVDKQTAEPQIAAKFGAFAPLFDLKEFAALSAEKKREAVLDLCSQCGMSTNVGSNRLLESLLIETVAVRVGSGSVDVLAASLFGGKLRTDLTSEQISDLWGKVALDESYRSAVENVMAQLKNGMTSKLDVGATCFNLLEHLKGIRKELKGVRDQAEDTARSLAEQRARLKPIAGTVADLLAKRSDLEEQRNEINEQIGNQKGRESAIAKLETHLKSAQERAALVVDLEDPEPLKSELAALDSQVGKATASIKGLKNIDDAAKELAECELSEAIWAKDVLKSKAAVADCKADIARVKKSEIHQALECLESIEWPEREETLKALDNVSRAIELLAAVVAGDTLQQHEDALVAAQESLKESEGKHAEVVEELSKQKRHVQELKKVHADWVEQMNRAEGQRKEILRKLESLERTAARAKDSQEQARADVLRYEKELQELRNAGGVVPMEDLESQAIRIKAAIDQISNQVDIKKEAESLDKVYSKAIEDRAAAEQRTEVTKDVEQAIRAVRDRYLHLAVSPIKERIDSVLAGARPDYACYCDLVNHRGRSIFDLGWITPDGVQISWPAMSGGEGSIFGAALAYAMTSLSTSPLKVLLIEGGEIDADRLIEVLKSLEAVADDISNVFVASHTGVESSESWNKLVSEPRDQQLKVNSSYEFESLKSQ